MQRTWQKIVRESLRWPTIVHPQAGFSTRSAGWHNHSSVKLAHRTPSCRRSMSTSMNPEFFTRTEGTLGPPHNPSASEQPSEAVITPARHAFQAAHAVRVAVAEGNLPDAYLILNSVFYAKKKSVFSPFVLGLTRFLPQNAFQPTAIPFDPTTPTRLISHTLLHSLVDHGYLKEASALAKQLMEYSIPIRPKSLDMLFVAMTDPAVNQPTPAVPLSQFEGTDILAPRLGLQQMATEGGKHALLLLEVARESQHKRTETMYRTLIRLCIINGEIIMASLLFGVMVKDWNAQVAELALKKSQEVGQNVPSDMSALEARSLAAPFPSPFLMNDILVETDAELSSYMYNQEEPSDTYLTSLQAIANITTLLDHRRLPFSEVSHLLDALTRLTGSKTKATITVPNRRPDDNPCLALNRDSASPPLCDVNPAVYFKDVLTRLCDDPPTLHVPHYSLHHDYTRNGGQLPALDHPSYIKLVHFAIFVKRSVELARRLVAHLTVERLPPIRNPGNLGALLIEHFREAAFMLKSDEAWETAEMLSLLRLNGSHSVKRPIDQTSPKDKTVNERSLPRHFENYDIHWKRYADLVFHPGTTPDHIVRRRLLFLFQAGQHGLLGQTLLQDLLPGYAAWISNPDRHRLLATRRRELVPDGQDSSWDIATAPAASTTPTQMPTSVSQSTPTVRVENHRSPAFVTAVLLGLKRAQMFQEMYGVYTWTQRLEELSFHSSDTEKWHLPIEAHSIVLGACEREAIILGGSDTEKIRRLKRWSEHRGKKTHIVRVRERIRRVLNRVFIQEKNGYVTPEPDEMFFNAALNAINAAHYGAKYPAKRSLADVWAELKTAEIYRAKRGHSRLPAMEGLGLVAKEMLDRGFPIPPAYRKHLVGYIDYWRCDEGAPEWEYPHLLRTATSRYWAGPTPDGYLPSLRMPR